MDEYTVVLTKSFTRKFEKLPHAYQQRVLDKISMLRKNPFHPSLRSKKLKGRDDRFECSVNMDIRLIWKYDGDNLIVMIDVGHHDILRRPP